jgi:hypothetical protein
VFQNVAAALPACDAGVVCCDLPKCVADFPVKTSACYKLCCNQYIAHKSECDSCFSDNNCTVPKPTPPPTPPTPPPTPKPPPAPKPISGITWSYNREPCGSANGTLVYPLARGSAAQAAQYNCSMTTGDVDHISISCSLSSSGALASHWRGSAAPEGLDGPSVTSNCSKDYNYQGDGFQCCFPKHKHTHEHEHEHEHHE